MKVELPKKNKPLLTLVNQYRASHRKKALVHDPRLSLIAQEMAEGMAHRETVNHNGARQRREEVYKLGYIYVAENIGYGVNRAHVAKMWYHSPPHRKAMLKPLMRKLGVGVARKNGVAYACTIFAY